MISDEKLKEWELLANEATPGPWYTCDYDLCTQKCPNDDSIHCPHGCEKNMVTSQQDIAFMAAAREAVPELIARVRELEASEKEATRIITDLNCCCDDKDRQIERLEREADWLAKQLSRMIDDCPTAKAKSYCYKAPFCVECWRDAAQKAVHND